MARSGSAAAGRAPIAKAGAALLVAVVLVVGLAAGAILTGAVPQGFGPFGGGAGTSGAATAPPRFVEETATAGIDHAYDGDFPFFVGGGVAVFDCDGDGRQDLYLAGGSNAAALYRNASEVGGALRFEHLVSAATDLSAVTGAYPLDVDGDGHEDLAVLRLGENVLLRGLGECRLERANEALGLDGGADWTAAFSATWEAADRLPTLAFGNYLSLGPDGEPGDTCADGALVRPAADGSRFAPPVALRPGRCTLSALFSSWDRSGRADLRLANDRHYDAQAQEQLWRVEPGRAPRLYTEADGWQPLRIWGMGIASQDLTGDGYPEVFLTSQGDNKLQALADGPAQPRYRDIALSRNATATRPYVGDTILPSTAWHAEFEDVNNDGRMDLFVSKGNVEAMPDYAARDPSNLLLGQADGTFTEAAEAAGIASFSRARGAALADLNLDGMLDLVVVNRRENVKLWRDVGWGDAAKPAPMGHWLGVRLLESGPNRDAIGAWVEVRADDRSTSREVTVGGGHAGGQSGWIHFGLGAAARAEVRVTWPDGEAGPWQPINADRFAIVERGAGIRGWEPPSE